MGSWIPMTPKFLVWAGALLNNKRVSRPGEVPRAFPVGASLGGKGWALADASLSGSELAALEGANT